MDRGQSVTTTTASTSASASASASASGTASTSSASTTTTTTSASTRKPLLAIPPPIKHLFDSFPLRTYPANELPLRSWRGGGEDVLVVWGEGRGGVGLGGGGWAERSCNPACLKWQAYLRFASIPHRTAHATNHASPSGALPFLLPAQKDGKPAAPVPSAKLRKWVRENSATSIEDPADARFEAYTALVEFRIRRAWLYTLYLSPNATTLAEPLYILPRTSNPLVRLSLSHTLRAAATAELLKHAPTIDAATLYSQADEAFAALDALLGSDTWFFGAKAPGWLDACVFAYTGLLLDEDLGRGWVDTRMGEGVRACRGLVVHRERIVDGFFGEGA